MSRDGRRRPWRQIAVLAIAIAPALSSAGCGGDLGAECPEGSVRAEDLCVPARLVDPCDEDADDFRSAACGGPDCDDRDPSANPAGVEVCNERDDDCDGATDEGLAARWYLDGDGDTAGDPEHAADRCDPPDDWVAAAGDCDDTTASVSPSAAEICNGTDDDCDGLTDEGVALRFYRDGDGDGYGDASDYVDACTLPAGYRVAAFDCDDADAAAAPSWTAGFHDRSTASGIWDYDCNGVDEPEYPDLLPNCDSCTAETFGWIDGPVPDCGSTGMLLDCSWGPGTGCHEATRDTVLQRCR